MMYLLAGFVGPLAVAIILSLRTRYWHWAWRMAAGIGFAAAILCLFQFAVDRIYAPSRSHPLEMPLALDRPGHFQTPVIKTVFNDYFYVNLVTDHLGSRNFFCIAGASPDILSVVQCGDHHPELNISWTALEGGHVVGTGGNQFALWHRIATAPTATERDVIAHGAGHLPADHPGDVYPTTVGLGWFSARDGHSYQLDVSLASSAPTLAKLHPRLEVAVTLMRYETLGAVGGALLFGCLIGALIIMLAGAWYPQREAAA